jgi:WD40 repeat protein
MRAKRFLGLALGILVWAVGNNLGFAQGNLPPVCTLGFSYVASVVFSPDGGYLAVGTRGGGSVQLIDTSSWQVIRTFEGHTSGVNSVAFSPDGKLLASGSSDETIKLWEVATGREVQHPRRPHPLGLFRGVQSRWAALGLRLLWAFQTR